MQRRNENSEQGEAARWRQQGGEERKAESQRRGATAWSEARSNELPASAVDAVFALDRRARHVPARKGEKGGQLGGTMRVIAGQDAAEE